MARILAIFLVLILAGCVTTSTKVLRKISLGMSKDEVVATIGEPRVVRGSIKNKFSQVVEVWEYELSKRKAGAFWGDSVATVCTFGIWGPVAAQNSENAIVNYWLYFYDGKLAQWGQAGDWRKEADRIYEVNFDTSTKLTQ